MEFDIETMLGDFDAARDQLPGFFFPPKDFNTIMYHFLMDLEHGYCCTAKSRVHVFSNQTEWAIVFEKLGYFNRAASTQIELTYFGNCIDYPQQTYEGKAPDYIDRTYISNVKHVDVISAQQYEAISDDDGFEILAEDCDSIEIRNEILKIPTEVSGFDHYGISIPDFEVGYGELTKYIAEAYPDKVIATEDEIRQHIIEPIPRILVVDTFAYISVYDEDTMPSEHETFQMLSKVADKADPDLWNPTIAANNHWSKWESGDL